MSDDTQESVGTRDVPVDQRARPDLRVADVAAVVYLGRDYEVALFASSPNVVQLKVSDRAVGPHAIQLAQTYHETTRVRLGPSAVVHLAINLAMSLRQNDPEEFESFSKTLAAYIVSDDAEIASQGSEQ